jgi:hypothetical protein
MLVLLAGCASPVPSTPGAPSASAGSPTPDPTVPSSRAGDVDALVEWLVDTHPEPFVGGTQASFEARAAALSARAEELSPETFLVELMRLVGGRDRDGHTGIVPFAQADSDLTAWPLALYAFEEGLYVVDAQSPNEDAIGTRVVAIGGRPVAEVVAAVTPLVARDNEWTVLARLPAYLVVPEILRGLDLLPSGAPALTLERDDGTRVDLSPAAIPIEAFRTWRALFDPLVPPTLAGADGPRYLRNRDEHFWSELVGDALYVGYNQVQATSPSGDTIGRLAQRIEDAFADGTARRVIVDIRGNPGGENGTYRPLLDALVEQARPAPGSVVVLIGRSTFSAAGNFATELRAEPAVRFVGEPTGAAPNQYGDATVVTLPSTGVRVHIATRSWEFAPGDESLAIEPDVRVPVTHADFLTGFDAAFEAALTHDRP